MTEVPPDTTVVGPEGEIPFGDAFEGRDEMVVYSHMFAAGVAVRGLHQELVADAAPGRRGRINAYGITFAILAPGPYEEIAAFRDFMGYTTPWYSNAHLGHPTMAHSGRLACYLKRDGKIYLTYWTTAGGDEVLSPLFGILDRTADGRREEWEDSPEGWPQLPTHSLRRTDEHGVPKGPRDGGRPPYQWTRIATGSNDGLS